MVFQKMSKEILFITGNQSKVAEMRAITGLEVKAEDREIEEIQSLKVEEVARAKAETAFRLVGRPVVVDDTGLEIEALGGLPGALVIWFLKTVGPAGILKMIKDEKNRKARVATCIAYADQNGVFTFLGTLEGEMAFQEKGENGFGYDGIFIPQGSQKTFAQMNESEKNALSMRKIALEKFKVFWENKRV